MPATNRAISCPARVCSPVATGPNAASTTPWVPHSPSATSRTCGNGLGASVAPERPNSSSFSSVADTSSTSPSMAITRSPRYHAPRVPAPAIGTAIRSNNSFIGASPSRVRAWEIALVDGISQLSRQFPRNFNPFTSCRSTSSYASPKNRFNANT